jgi:hypothetical protein
VPSCGSSDSATFCAIIVPVHGLWGKPNNYGAHQRLSHRYSVCKHFTCFKSKQYYIPVISWRKSNYCGADLRLNRRCFKLCANILPASKANYLLLMENPVLVRDVKILYWILIVSYRSDLMFQGLVLLEVLRVLYGLESSRFCRVVSSYVKSLI